jgi:endoglucanase
LTLFPQWPSLTIIPDKGLPRWQSVRDTPLAIDEGGDFQLRLRCVNSIVGARVEFRLTGGNSLASGGNWLRSFADVLTGACNAVGLKFIKLTSATTPKAVGTFNCLIEVGPNYKDGAIATFLNTSRRNRKDDAPLNADGTPGSRRMNVEFRNVSPASTNGTVSGQIPLNNAIGGYQAFLDVRDTSRSPAGYPTVSVLILQDDLVSSSPLNLVQDDVFVVRLKITNAVPGTQIRMFAAGNPYPNDGQYDVQPAFRTEIARAAIAAGCTCFIPRWTPTTALQWFNGGIITIPETTPANFNIDMRFAVEPDAELIDQKLFYIFSTICVEGDISEFDTVSNKGDYIAGGTYATGDYVKMPSGRSFVYSNETTTSGNAPPSDETTFSNSYWRQFLPIAFSGGVQQKQFTPVPPRYWELRATSDRSTITYTLQGPTGFVGDNVDLLSVNPPPGFDAALARACSGSAPITYSGGVLTARATDRKRSNVTFTVPHAGQGKHTLRLMNNRSGGAQPFAAYKVIPDACVFLTAPVMPVQPATLYGINLAGGEFGDDYTSTGTRTQYNGGRYYYPSSPENPLGQQHQKMDYFFRKGARAMRMPVSWPRVQPQLFGPLYYGEDAPFTQFSSQDMRRILEAIDYWVGLGGHVNLELHSYMSYVFPTVDANGVLIKDGEKVGYDSPRVTTEALIDVCVRMANVIAPYGGSVSFGIANEPSGDRQSARRVADNMQAVVNAVRARTPALNLLMRGTSRFSSCRNFVNNGDAAANVTSYDPANNHCIELHNYFDGDASGRSGLCVVENNDGTLPLQAATQWFKAYAPSTGLRGFMGEIAAGNPEVSGQENCKPIIQAAYAYMKANPDAWVGWTTWGTGFKPTYFANLEPIGYYQAGATDAPNMTILQPYL